ncbi:hypothetical protein F4802DRAFT_619204 [Xylaria palmicola]|nr:hypothetical protein F4802DRAFT_619204 [Xylaria palmicola]
MPLRHRIEVRVPLFAGVSPAGVVATLQTFEPLLNNHPYVITYRPKAGRIGGDDLGVIRDDPFFRGDQPQPDPDLELDPAAEDARWWLCDVWEDVYWVPFIVPYFSRLKRYLAVGCRTPSGIRFRQRVSGGAVTRGAFTVVERATGRPYVAPEPRRRAPGDDDDDDDDDAGSEVWEGDTETEKGSVLSDADAADARASEGEDGGEDRSTESREETAGEKEAGDWDAQDDTDTESEPTWELVCECEVEMPYILAVPKYLARDADRKLCKYLCKCVIREAYTAFDE